MFQKHLHIPYRLYGYLTDINRSLYQHFAFVIDSPDTDHASKLNALAEHILSDAREDDWIVFLDGDAFPVDDLAGKITPMLAHAPLVAIQRLENLGEKHAHPSFCVTTVGFWKEISGDWNKGYHWINALNAEETDVGAQLLYQMLKRNVHWIPLHRTNRMNILPVWYGIYGDVIYHHGAGFRDRGCRKVWYEAGLYDVHKKISARILNNIIPARYQKAMRDSIFHPEGRMKRRLDKKLNEIEKSTRAEILRNPDFVQSLR